MSGELQATVDISLEFHKFYNVDLFQRGFYQLRTVVKTSPKFSSKVEVSLPRRTKNDLSNKGRSSVAKKGIENKDGSLPSVINGSAVTKTFQILYRNEEVALDQVAQFKVHLLVEVGKLEESLEKCDIQIGVELWYSEDQNAFTLNHGSTPSSSGQNSNSNSNSSSSGCEPSSETIECVSSRNLHLKFEPARGLHCHLPILFDYFHLSAVSLTFHACLTSLHLPYINSLRSGLGSGSNGKTEGNNGRESSKKTKPTSMEGLFFGVANNNNTIKSRESERKSRQSLAKKIRKEILSLLLSSFESLQMNLVNLGNCLPEIDRPQMEIVSCAKRLQKFTEMTKNITSEEEFVDMTNSDISQLCGELILLWNVFLGTVIGQYRILQHLARVYHLQRVRRFSEAFVVIENQRKSALESCDAKYQEYASVADSFRSSRYFNALPNLPVFCTEIDGTPSTLPLIFEDIYVDEELLGGRRHSLSEVEKSKNSKPEEEEEEDSRLLTLNEVLCSSNSSAAGKRSLRKAERPYSVPSLRKMEDGDSFSLCDITSDKKATIESFSQQQSMQYFNKKEPDSTRLNGATHNNAKTVPIPPKRSVKNKLIKQQSESAEKSVDVSGFSHLEWSASVPYNLAEEPDEVTGMKHSHSCQSVSGLTLEELSVQKSCENSPVPEKLHNINEEESNSKNGSLTSHEEGTTNEENSVWKSEEEEETNSIDQTIKDLEQDFDQFVSAKKVARLTQIEPRETQEELSRKLEKLRQESRSVLRGEILQQRPRAKSEEAYKFPPDMRPRTRLSSEGRIIDGNTQSSNGCEENKINGDKLLSAPGLVKLAVGEEEEEDQRKMDKATKKLPVPPPRQFRDNSNTNQRLCQTGNSYSNMKSDNNNSPQTRSEKGSEMRMERASKIQRSLEEKMENRKSLLSNVGEDTNEVSNEVSNVSSKSHQLMLKDTILMEEEEKPSGEIRLPFSRGKEKEVKMSSDFKKVVMEGKKFPFDSDLFIVESTGDYLETKSLPRPKQRNKKRELLFKNGTGDVLKPPAMLQELVSKIDDATLGFVKAKEAFKKSMACPGILYSDFNRHASTVPYFHLSDELRFFPHQPCHLIVCVHGLDGNSADLRLIKIYLEMALPGHNMDFLMSEMNQGDTFSSFETMTDRLVEEILSHLTSHSTMPARISFVGHSLGNILIRSAISRSKLAHLVPFFYTYLSLSGPHLGSLYNNSGLVNMGMWFMQKWKKSGSLHQLSLKDSTDIRQTFLYQLSRRSNLHQFRHVLLASSMQDRYVPWHSARIELCKSATKDNSITGAAYREMVQNILSPVVKRGNSVTLARYDIHHALPSNTNALIGRAAHIAVLDSELFIEKFLIVSTLKYFK